MYGPASEEREELRDFSARKTDELGVVDIAYISTGEGFLYLAVVGLVGDCYDNTLCESFFAALECELLQGRKSVDRGEARRGVFQFFEGRYNRRRRHSGLGYLSQEDLLGGTA